MKYKLIRTTILTLTTIMLFNGIPTSALDGKYDETFYNNNDILDYAPGVQGQCSSPGGGTSADTTSGDASVREQNIMEFLTGKGLTLAAAAGVTANIAVESAHTFNPRIIQGGAIASDTFTLPSDQGGGGFGIAQWTDHGRQIGLREYAKAQNGTIFDLSIQEGYLWKELSTSYNTSTLSKIKSMTDPGEAAKVVMINYESPLDQSQSAQDGRAAGARGIYQKYNGIVQGGSGTVDTSATPSASVSSCTNQSSVDQGGLGVTPTGFTFPEKTTQAAIKKGNGSFTWCYTSQTSCHHDYWAADIANMEGTTVVAAKDGVVVSESDPSACSGFDAPRVHIKGSDGLYYYYTHMKPGSIKVHTGQKIQAGQEIGLIGPASCAEGTSPHLHFQITNAMIQDTSSMSGQYYCSGGATHEGKINGDPCFGTKTVFNLNPQPGLIQAFQALP